MIRSRDNAGSRHGEGSHVVAGWRNTARPILSTVCVNKLFEFVAPDDAFPALHVVAYDECSDARPHYHQSLKRPSRDSL